jgi:serine/threonine-protein kinase
MAEPSDGAKAGEPEPTVVSAHDWSSPATPADAGREGAGGRGGIVVHPPDRPPPAATVLLMGASAGASGSTAGPTEVATGEGGSGATTELLDSAGRDDAATAVPGGTTAMLNPTRTELATDARRRRSRGPASFPTVPGYELLEELGRGGMGVVYKAHHKRMDIPVALKMVLAGAHASDDQLARFEDEARTLAQHRHPNIVQIYNVDEHDGLPYIALEYVGGGTLADQIGGKPMDPEVAAEHARTLAAAMAYAHGAGTYPVIHRDLKPANVLVAEDGTLKITDFGLAKAIEEESGGDEPTVVVVAGSRGRPGSGSGSTRTGAIMGTPSYMAPEQAWGRTEQIGPASDQYAVGVMLYEMLTGRPPLQAAHRLQTLELVRHQEPVPPTRLQPRIPRDLETICLRALQKEPHKRYPSCADLAEDLRRFLAGEPILARPVPAWERAWRWCRRHPAIAGLSATVAALGLALLVGTTYGLWRLQRINADLVKARENMRGALKIAHVKEVEANVAARVAGEARDEAARQTALALSTLNELVGATQVRLRDRADLQDLRRELLKTAEGGVARILRDPRNANRVDLVTAAIYQKMGQIAQQTGALDQALDAYTKMEAVIADLGARQPDDLGVANAMAKVKNTLGDLQIKEMGHAEVGLRLYREGLALRQRMLASLRPSGTRAEVDLALANVAVNHGLIADALLKLGKVDEALEALAACEAARGELSREAAATRAQRQEHAGMLELKGKILLKRGRVDDGRLAFEESFTIRERDARSAPDSLSARNNFYLSIITLGHFALLVADDPAEALRLYTRAREGFERLREADRQNVGWTRNLAKTWYYAGEALRRLDETDASSRAFGACLALREELDATLGDAHPEKKMVELELAVAKARGGEAATAAAIVAAVLETPRRDNRLGFHAACALAQAAAAAADGSEAARHRDGALALLDGLVAAGWDDADALRTDPDLEPVRDDPRFAAMLGRIPPPGAKRPRR